MYRTQEDASLRLKGTVIRLANGEPCYIRNAETASKLRYYRYTDDGLDQSDVPLEGSIKNGDFDLTPIPLGYINRGGKAVYASRMPIRKYKQGLSEASLHLEGGNRMDTNSVLLSSGFYRMVMNVYPSLVEARDAHKKFGLSSVAFHKEWAIEFLAGQEYLQYKGRTVGLFKDEKPQLDESYHYLKEAALEAGI